MNTLFARKQKVEVHPSPPPLATHSSKSIGRNGLIEQIPYLLNQAIVFFSLSQTSDWLCFLCKTLNSPIVSQPNFVSFSLPEVHF